VTEKKSCVVALSGGLDSTAFLGVLLREGFVCFPFVVDYGDTQREEKVAAQRIVEAIVLKTKYRIAPLHVVQLEALSQIWLPSALITGAVPEKYDRSVIVPLRNAVLLTIGAIIAIEENIGRVAYAAQLDDSKLAPDGDPFYPDSCAPFIRALERALNLGHHPVAKKKFTFDAPVLRGWDKVTLVAKGFEALGDILFLSYSCYRGGPKHCGRCSSCEERRRTFQQLGLSDKTPYEQPSNND